MIRRSGSSRFRRKLQSELIPPSGRVRASSRRGTAKRPCSAIVFATGLIARRFPGSALLRPTRVPYAVWMFDALPIAVFGDWHGDSGWALTAIRSAAREGARTAPSRWAGADVTAGHTVPIAVQRSPFSHVLALNCMGRPHHPWYGLAYIGSTGVPQAGRST
jgi:hypothetical protein